MTSRAGTDRAGAETPPDLPRVEAGRGFALLRDIVVVDLTTSIAGPYATMLLADFGADIIKIEAPDGGDAARAWGPPFLDGESLWFLSVNRSKRSVVLDIARAEGQRILHDLVAGADVVVTNQPPHVQRKLRSDYETLAAINPRLVYVSITGFGLEGERADWAGYDLIAEGYAGIMDLTGTADRPPQKVGTPAADLLAGQDAAMAAMAALIDRQRSGSGHLIDVALVDQMVRFTGCRIVPFLGSGKVPRRSGGTDSPIAVYQPFDTADDPITLGLGTDAIWKRFWELAGDPAYGARAEFATNAQRQQRRAEIVERIQALLRRRPRAEWLDLCAAARIPAGPINRVDQVVDDAALRRRGLFYELHDSGRAVPQVGLGIQLDGRQAVPRAAPPLMGADTERVLRERLGLDDTRVDALRSAGILGRVN